MRALEVFAIYVVPFLLLGLAIKLIMKRYAVDLTDIQKQAGPNRKARRVFLLGGWRKEE
ncbi:hypothetical protein [Bradyrhizobium sp. NP1]|uniref:hypothetical protein n=1 Tax=Bradyrhizobium sp. NP1 TaxID=3049772 RepID=UPI0025A4F5F6|nr:hypothetical protein [Bradyrhizobium sp. NP1]WJR76154.1 hypothetical protein QOU61_25770 [Bradyrhizobium sp. NP1]